PIRSDGTRSWQRGADNGPDAALRASENMELFDIQTRTAVYRRGVHLAPAVTEGASAQNMAESVYKPTKNYLKQDKFVTLFGGEHSVSIGSIRAFNEPFEDLTVVQIDAHADLRPSYEGSSCNHACAVYEASKTTNLVQVGIRSMDEEELENLDENQVYFAHNLYEDWLHDAIGQMTLNVFITVALDACDPSSMP